MKVVKMAPNSKIPMITLVLFIATTKTFAADAYFDQIALLNSTFVEGLYNISDISSKCVQMPTDMLSKLTILLLASTVCIAATKEFGATIYFDQLNLLNSPYSEGFYNVSTLRAAKYNRTTFVVNAGFETFVD